MRVLAQQPEGHHPLPDHRVRHGAQRAAALREYILPSKLSNCDLTLDTPCCRVEYSTLSTKKCYYSMSFPHTTEVLKAFPKLTKNCLNFQMSCL